MYKFIAIAFCFVIWISFFFSYTAFLVFLGLGVTYILLKDTFFYFYPSSFGNALSAIYKNEADSFFKGLNKIAKKGNHIASLKNKRDREIKLIEILEEFIAFLEISVKKETHYFFKKLIQVIFSFLHTIYQKDQSLAIFGIHEARLILINAYKKNGSILIFLESLTMEYCMSLLKKESPSEAEDNFLTSHILLLEDIALLRIENDSKPDIRLISLPFLSLQKQIEHKNVVEKYPKSIALVEKIQLDHEAYANALLEKNVAARGNIFSSI